MNNSDFEVSEMYESVCIEEALGLGERLAEQRGWLLIGIYHGLSQHKELINYIVCWIL